jgi:hypothetical protein
MLWTVTYLLLNAYAQRQIYCHKIVTKMGIFQVEFEVPMAVALKSLIVWVVLLCSLVDVH